MARTNLKISRQARSIMSKKAIFIALAVLLTSGSAALAQEKEELKFSQEQYDMLKRCSDKKNMTKWNEWRKANPDEKILLRGANLHGANLQGADLSWSNLKDAKIWEFNLPGVDLSEANLQGADLRWANLQGAKLFRANLQGADLSGSKLYGADLWEADLNQVNMYLVRFDSSTRCRSLKGKEFYGSPVFKRFVEDSDFLEDFKRRHPVIYWIWFVLSDCGRSIALWAGWSLAFAVFFAHVFYRLGPESMKVADLPWNFSTVVYYSVVTFTTLGFGDVVPKTNAAAWWVMAEVITGYVMLGGLISIFANKLARRS